MKLIARTFGAVGAQVRLVVLNACYTAPIAEALRAHVDCVVGISDAIHDDAARSFAIGPSDSGKSSLVAAGVLPQLARGLSGLGPCVDRGRSRSHIARSCAYAGRRAGPVARNPRGRLWLPQQRLDQ